MVVSFNKVWLVGMIELGVIPRALVKSVIWAVIFDASGKESLPALSAIGKLETVPL